MVAAAKSVAKVASSGLENDDLRMIGRASAGESARAKAQTKLKAWLRVPSRTGEMADARLIQWEFVLQSREGSAILTGHRCPETGFEEIDPALSPSVYRRFGLARNTAYSETAPRRRPCLLPELASDIVGYRFWALPRMEVVAHALLRIG